MNEEYRKNPEWINNINTNLQKIQARKLKVRNYLKNSESLVKLQMTLADGK